MTQQSIGVRKLQRVFIEASEATHRGDVESGLDYAARHSRGWQGRAKATGYEEADARGGEQGGGRAGPWRKRWTHRGVDEEADAPVRGGGGGRAGRWTRRRMRRSRYKTIENK
jgi:hypothetical protein